MKNAKFKLGSSLILVGLLLFIFVSCHQWAVWLKDEKKYSGNLTVPTMFTSKNDTMYYGCDKNFCSFSMSVWLKVVNPTGNTIEPGIYCKYYLNGVYQNGCDREIKKFKISPGHSRRLLVDNSVLVVNGRTHTLSAHCEMTWDTLVKFKRLNSIKVISVKLIPKEVKNVQAHPNYRPDDSLGYVR